MGILVESFQVEVGVRRNEVEHVLLPMVRPIFPTYVPSLHQNLVQSVLGSEVDVSLHLVCVSRMASVRLRFAPVYLVKFDRWELIGVVPCAFSNNHFPPHTAVFCGMNPTRVFYLARLVEVQYEVARQHIACVIAHHYRSPRTLTRGLHAPLGTVCVWGEPAFKRHGLVV